MTRMAVPFHNIPKAELHVHLEGSVEPETLCELEPRLTPLEVRKRYCYEDFPAFIECFKWVIEQLKAPRDYALIARRLFERLAAQNVRYVEVTQSTGVVLLRKQQFGPIFDALEAEASAAPLEVRWVLDGVRQFGPDHVMAVARLAGERVSRGVVALGVGGNEQLGPVEWFAEPFAYARDRGLRLTVHAGETVGPESVWGALRLGADRIGHGIRAIEDPALLDHLRHRGIPLEVCITSNVATGAVASLEEHPVRRLFEAGVPLTLNTDDPAMFHTTLLDEYDLAVRRFGFTAAEIESLIGNSFRYAFRKA